VKKIKLLFLLSLLAFVLIQLWPRLFYKKQVVSLTETPVIQREFTHPIVPLPFVSAEYPVPKEELPISPRDVQRTIEVVVPPSEREQKIVLIEDKEETWYTSLKTDPKAKVTVTKWKESVASFKPQLGLSYNYMKGAYYFGVSLNLFQMSSFALGFDAGLERNASDAFIGAAIRYEFAKLKPSFEAGEGVRLYLSLGYTLTGQGIYGGINAFW